MFTVKYMMACLVCLLPIVFIAGCSDSPETDAPRTPATAEDVKEKAEQTVEAVREYTQQQMEDYQDQIQAKLDKFDQNLEELKRESASLQSDAKEKYFETIAGLQQKQMEARATLKGLERESGEAWSRMKQRLDEMVGELVSAFDQADTSA